VAAVAPRLEFTPPRPGSYVLQKIQPIANATLLDVAGRPTRLSAATTGRITLLTFFYTYCADPLGCPFAYHTLIQVRRGVVEDPRLTQRVQFLSVSLDPTTDTPEVIGRPGGAGPLGVGPPHATGRGWTPVRPWGSTAGAPVVAEASHAGASA